MKEYSTITTLAVASILILAATAFKLVAAQGASELSVHPVGPMTVKMVDAFSAADFRPGDAKMVFPPSGNSCLFEVRTSTDLTNWTIVTNGTLFPPSEKPRYFRMSTFGVTKTYRF